MENKSLFNNNFILSLVGFIGISSGIIQVFQVFNQDSTYNKYVVWVCVACFIIYVLVNRRNNRSPLKKVEDYLLISKLNYEVSFVTNQTEIEEIVDLARSNYSCPINETDFKTPIWKKNNKCFFVVKNSDNEVIANINLFPIKNDAFDNLRSGKILENELSASDIYDNTEESKKDITHIYVEGLLSKSKDGISDKTALILIAWNFEKIISNLSLQPQNKITICGIGGSPEGENLMKKLGFRVITPAINRKDNLDFLVIDCSKLITNLNNRTVIGLVKKLTLK